MDDFCGSILEIMGRISQRAIECVDENYGTPLNKKESLQDESYIKKVVDKSKGIKTNVKSEKRKGNGLKKNISELLDEFSKDEEPEIKQDISISKESTIVKRFSKQEQEVLTLEID